MPDHIFRYTDLEPLEINPPQGKYHLLVVGTFNANINKNSATWFYGRPENEFWCLLPRMMNEPTLHSVDRDEDMETLTGLWKQYCLDNRIIIVDLFKVVHKELVNHSDKELKQLNENEYTVFDFETAFAMAQFDSVLFTWKGMKNNTLTRLKNRYIQFFEPRGSAIIHMLTPSLAYPKPRSYKLDRWKEKYRRLQF